MLNIKSITLMLCIAFVISSCTKEAPAELKTINCQNNFDYPNLPESNFLDGYYDLLTTEFTEQQLISCECDDLLAIQEFRIENINTFLPFPSNPMEMTCQELQENCQPFNEIDFEAKINEILLAFNTALEQNQLLQGEVDLMESFLNDYFIDNDVDFQYYWCSLDEVEKPSNISPNVQGLLSAFVLTTLQGPHDYYLANTANFKSDANIQTRVPSWLKWAARGIRGHLVGIAVEKYVGSMWTLGEGLYNGQDTSYEALCVALD